MRRIRKAKRLVLDEHTPMWLRQQILKQAAEIVFEVHESRVAHEKRALHIAQHPLKKS